MALARSLASRCKPSRPRSWLLGHNRTAVSVASSSSSSGALANELADGFAAQSEGRYNDALRKYRALQRSPSPLIQALANNAEGLLLLRAPISLTGFDEDLAPCREACQPGDEVLAPWAQDGGEYPATIADIDHVKGMCTVDWQDGADTHRTVPVASLSTLRRGVSDLAWQQRPSEVQAWCVRRALRAAVVAWEIQAEAGVAHDQFMDMVGLLSDLALGELRAALLAPQGTMIGDGLGQARRHLQRARWMAERAYSPAPATLAILSVHRAEVLRLSAAGALLSGKASKPPLASYREVLALHEQSALHFAAVASVAVWRDHRKSSSSSSSASAWRREGGDIPGEAVQELLWAKALASVASCKGWSKESASARVARQLRKQSRQSRQRAATARPPQHGRPLRKRTRHGVSSGRSSGLSSLPEKLLPQTPGLPQAMDPLLRVQCPARAAAERAWRALEMAAGRRPVARRHTDCHFWGSCSPQVADELARACPDGHMLSRLLLDVGVIVFAMGCSVGQAAWARRVAAPLAEEARRRLAFEPLGVIDDSAAASTLVAEFLSQRHPVLRQPGLRSSLRSRQDLFASAYDDTSGSSTPLTTAEQRRCRILHRQLGLASYNALEELYIISMGPTVKFHVPSSPALTWYLEGFALSHTAPVPSKREHPLGDAELPLLQH